MKRYCYLLRGVFVEYSTKLSKKTKTKQNSKQCPLFPCGRFCVGSCSFQQIKI